MKIFERFLNDDFYIIGIIRYLNTFWLLEVLVQINARQNLEIIFLLRLSIEIS